MTLTSKVKETISRYELISEGERVLVGLSGGADSVCLLLCLKELGINVSAFHVNHNLRGEESIRDKDFCIALCERLGIKIYTADIDVKGYCEKNHLSIEEGARELRYKELMSIKADKIATAHNINDCLETTIFNLARGTGLKGLCSIPPKRDNIVRPLIECTREEIEGFLASKGQDFVTDSTNLEDEYTRNKIRHNVIPVLMGINSSLYASYSETREHLTNDEMYLEQQANELLSGAYVSEKTYDAGVLGSNKHLMPHVISGLLKENGIEVSALRTKMTTETIQNGGKYNICGGIYVVCDGKTLRLLSENESVKCEDFAEQITGIPSESLFFGKRVTLIKQEDFEFKKGIHKEYKGNIIDADKLSGGIILRNRRNGDKIALAGRGFTSKLKVLFNEKIPLEERGIIALLCDDKGIFFVEGFGVDERVKVDESTKSIIIIAIS
ncbi:MAG: tRNA lysidine(34) synthetase TilS [Ruminococcus sp.]|nr:tRNA lysidine(34) synthetase TilS [Ruminococcus sp.]